MTDLSAVETIFLAALEQATPEARAAYLDRACGPDADLRRRVERLLAAQPKVGSFLQAPAPGVTVDEAPVAERPGTSVGPYRLMEQIGEGGMGLVFVAEQTQPVRRKVALKIIKPGMDSAQVVARFEAERQALAMMDHQNIAKVYDAGTTESGRPYFVMELVHGVPITDYCDANKLTPRQRLELFVAVCHALQHAHQKGVIHRDVKPSNVLVTMYDDKPVPKVIDFGVAKAVEQRLTEKTVYTQFGTLVGTFEYMSPEQAEMNALGVDTRSDVYALGVLLYELLTGTTPLERLRLREAAFGEIVRLIKEEEPPRPSVRLSTSGALAKVAAARQTEPARLSRLVRGELDWVVMRCLEKDRTRRYDTASALARDVERYLKDEPVEARPPSTWYRSRKFARRNKVALTTAALVGLALVAGTALSTWQAVRAVRAEQDALSAREQEAHQRQLMEEERNRAREAERAAKANELMAGDRTVEMMMLMETFIKQAGDTAGAFKDKGKLEQAVAFYEEASAAAKAKLGLLHPSYLISLANLAAAYQAAGRFDEAIRLGEVMRAFMATDKTGPGPNHPATFAAMTYLASSYQAAGDRDRAVALNEQVYAKMKETFGPRHPVTFRGLSNLAATYWANGKGDKALPLWEEMVQLQMAEMGPEHPTVLGNMNNLAQKYNDAGRPAEAIPLFEQALPAVTKQRGAEDDYTLTLMNDLGVAYRDAWRLDPALPLLEKTLAAREAKYGRKHSHTLRSVQNLAVAWVMAGKPDRAIPLLEHALPLREADPGPDRSETIFCLYHLAEAYLDHGDSDKAEPLYVRCMALQRKRLGPDHPEVAGALASLGLSYLRQQKYAEAGRVLDEALRIRAAKLPDHWKTFNAKAMLGGALLGQGRDAEARALLREGYEGMRQREATVPADGKARLTDALEWLAQLHDARGELGEAARWRAELEARRKP